MPKSRTFTSSAAGRLDSKNAEDFAVFGNVIEPTDDDVSATSQRKADNASGDAKKERKKRSITVVVDSELYHLLRQYLADPSTPYDDISTLVRTSIAYEVRQWQRGTYRDGK